MSVVDFGASMLNVVGIVIVVMVVVAGATVVVVVVVRSGVRG